MQTAPALSAAAPDTDEIKETIAQINNQTRAVEQAVQEVMVLRAA